MAEPLLTTRELALWTTQDESFVETDPFATEVIDKVSEMARFLGGHPEWHLGNDEDKAPFDVRLVVLQICKRCYANPDQVVQEGNVGPIGGDRVLDVAALLFELTETERATLTKYNPEGDPDQVPSGLFTVDTSYGGVAGGTGEVYMSDDQQINMHPGQSAWPPEDIPVFSESDGAMVAGAD